jgi:hypothetical protein
MGRYKDKVRHAEVGKVKTGWDKRGEPSHKNTTPGYRDMPASTVGTPGYIRGAAERAEKRLDARGDTGRQQFVGDCHKANHGEHRLHDDHFDTGGYGKRPSQGAKVHDPDSKRHESH